MLLVVTVTSDGQDGSQFEPGASKIIFLLHTSPASAGGALLFPRRASVKLGAMSAVA